MARVEPDGDPFAELGLARDADAEQVRAARRRLARAAHPDAGGDTARMAALNAAAARALREIDARGAPAAATSLVWGRGQNERSGGRERDVPSFTVEALPVEAFEALVVVSAWFGEIIDDEPPYRLDVHLTDPAVGWCRFEIVPDAGASTVSLTVGSWADAPAAPVEQIRDLFVDALNRLDWETMGPG